MDKQTPTFERMEHSAKPLKMEEEQELQEESCHLSSIDLGVNPLQNESFAQHWNLIFQQMELLDRELGIFVAQTNSLMEMGLTSYQQLEFCWKEGIHARITVPATNLSDSNLASQRRLALEGDESYGTTEEVDITRPIYPNSTHEYSGM
jgi:hypothetical protein